MSKIFLSLLSLVMITVMAGCSAPAPEEGADDGAEPTGRHEDDAPGLQVTTPAPEATPAPAPEAAPAPAPEATPAPEAAPAAEGAAATEAPAPSASAAPLTGTKWA